MKQWLICLTFVLLGSQLKAQRFDADSLMIAGGFDVFKISQGELQSSFQAGLEVHYFLKERLSAQIGTEYWSGEPHWKLTVGSRYYLKQHPLFFRARGILLGEADFAIGSGYAFDLHKGWAIEVMADYFFAEEALALRFGLSKRLGKFYKYD
ncbi:hypothetical protein AAG747_18125 [Rapidithrix thailandica]|uniref:Outer membrane protein beta-barrel domain-containing protein n=1 Tax=Rapidithrix thailandica TaxID=413964 RepID=A0AAW9S7K3_9BACT